MSAVKAITSRDNPLLARLRKLGSDPGGYRRLGEIWIEGEHLCSAFAGRGGVVPQALITQAAWDEPALRQLASRAASVAIVPTALMASVSALESAPPLGFVVRWPGEGHVRPHAATVVLDRLQDAGNVGNILRSASAFGFSQVIALKGTVALWSPKVLRAGMGAHFGLQLVEGAQALDALSVPMVATNPRADRTIHRTELPWPCAWVLGHEGGGIAPALEARCALQVRIAQPGGEESLNVSAAAAICLYESARQRDAS